MLQTNNVPLGATTLYIAV